MMTAEAFKREKEYQATMSIVRSMVKSGVIDQCDYEKTKALMLQKYSPLLGSLIG